MYALLAPADTCLFRAEMLEGELRLGKHRLQLVALLRPLPLHGAQLLPQRLVLL